MKYTIHLLLILSLVLFSCGDENPNDNSTEFENLDYFYTNANSLKIDVAFETGAEPFVSGGFSGTNWDFTENNIKNLVSGRTNTISVVTDKQLSEMTPIPNQSKSSYTAPEILAIAEDYQSVPSSENQGVVLVLFLDGYYNLNGNEQTGVLGLSVGSFVVAVFKPVISSIQGGGVLGGDPKFAVEQATVVHELGHALGLVNAGVDLTTTHQDETNGKHCTNTDCVMYWEIASTSGASGLLGSGSSVSELVFGQECINDITAFMD